MAIQVYESIAIPLVSNSDDNTAKVKRSEDGLLPSANFSVVNQEKLLKLKELADAADDPKLKDLYRAVNHYVQMAKKNNEYVVWKYDANEEGLVLVLKQNLNGILYYG